MSVVSAIRPLAAVTSRSLAALTAVLCGVHAALQGSGAASTWRPCFAEGFDSAICLDLQYTAPSPWWIALGWLWFLELALAIGTVALTAASRPRRGVRLGAALAAALLIGLSNMVFDYAGTPLINGGYVSADNAPGFGYLGAGLLAAAAVALMAAALWPRRR
jgi:hypothetical protein